MIFRDHIPIVLSSSKVHHIIFNVSKSRDLLHTYKTNIWHHRRKLAPPPHNALKSTVNRKGQKRRIWLLPTQTLSYGEPKFIVILLPCHTTMLKSHIMKYFTFEINLLGEKWKFCNFSFRPPRNALKVLK